MFGGTSRLGGGLPLQLIHEHLQKHANEPDQLRWGVAAVGFSDDKPGRPSTLTRLREQDGLYSLTQRWMDPHDGTPQTATSIIGCISETLHAREDRQRTLDLFKSPDTKMAIMAITTANYFLKQGRLDPDATSDDIEQLRHDLRQPREPISAIGMLVEGLRLRMNAGLPGLTVLSCDNLPPPSGDVTRDALLRYCDLIGEKPGSSGLYEYIQNDVFIPTTMVDRICPEPPRDRQWCDFIQSSYGFVDERPLVTEGRYDRFLVIETGADKNDPRVARFQENNPFAGSAGVILTETDGLKWAALKSRVLNGQHVWLALMGTFYGGHQMCIHEVVQHPELGPLFQQLTDHEVRPAVAAMPSEMTLPQYLEKIRQRFSNANLPDQVGRIDKECFGRLPRLYSISSDLLLRHNPEENDPPNIDMVACGIAAWVVTRTVQRRAGGEPLKVEENLSTTQIISEIRADLSVRRALEAGDWKTACEHAFASFCRRGMLGDIGQNSFVFREAVNRFIAKLCGEIDRPV
jgi:mannitol-1-phosphate/altronate dehydrogenase